MGANDAAAKSNALAATAEQLPWQHRKNMLFRLNGTPGSPMPCSSGPQLRGTSQSLLHLALLYRVGVHRAGDDRASST